MGFRKTCNVTSLLQSTVGNNSPFILLSLVFSLTLFPRTPLSPSSASTVPTGTTWYLCPQTSTVAQLAQPSNSPITKLMAALW